MPNGGVKEWSPEPVRDVVEFLERHSVDSSRWIEDQEALEIDTSRTMSVALPQVARGAFPAAWFQSFHVTDDPENALRAIREGADLMETQKYWYGSLCPGLYVSTSVQYWRRAVSSKRYEFMRQLPPEDRRRLAEIVLAELARQREARYITESEYEVGVRSVGRDWAERGNAGSALQVVGQPYNINIPEIARRAGFARPTEPFEVEVLFTGRYLEFESGEAIDAAWDLARLTWPERKVDRKDVCLSLRGHGWDGIYTKSGFSTEPELVIVNGERIVKFADWIRD